jgi:hypothetical protein
MKTLFSTILLAVSLCFAFNAQAAGKDLQTGGYTLHAYTLSNGSPISSQSSNSYDNITFRNLYIFSDAMDTVFNRDDTFQSNNPAYINKNRFQGIALKAAYSPTSAITFHSSIGLTDTSSNENLDYTDRLGWELDLGMAYQFLGNFAYEVHFGYMDTGQLFTESNRYKDIENITIVTNKLTMSF